LKRFDCNFTREEKIVNNVEGQELGCNIDTVWNSDTDAIDHITSELDKLVVHGKYNGQDQIHAANGGGMQITQIGSSTLNTPSHILSLKNVLSVGSSHKNPVFIHHFTHDNHVSVE
jgi:hypothetical protein